MSIQPASADIINNAHKVVTKYAQGVVYQSRRSSGIVERLLFQQAQTGQARGKYFGIKQVRDALNGGMPTKEAVVWVRKRATYGAGSFNPNSACADAPQEQWTAQSFYINKTVTDSVEIDLNRERCTPEELANIAGDAMARCIEGVTEIFSNEVEAEIYAKHIGKLPSKIGGVGQLPRDFSQLSVFRANGVEVNEAADGEFAVDLRMANVGRFMALVSGLGMRYAQQKKVTVINDRGTDFTAEAMKKLLQSEYFHTPILAGVLNPATYGTTGSPMLVIEDGAIHIISTPFYTAVEAGSVPQMAAEAGKRRYSIMHPYLPGIWIDIVESVEGQCDNFYQYPKVKIQMAIRYLVLSQLSCDYENGIFTKGVNGVMLYFLTCSDKGACDYEDYRYTPPVLSYNVSDKCEIDAACAEALACKVVPMQVGFHEIGGVIYAVFAADVKPSGGAQNPATYEWLLNGNPFDSTNTPSLLISLDELTQGDVISMYYIDSLDCEQTVEFAPVDLEGQNLCGALLIEYDGGELEDGDTLALGALPQTGAGVTTPIVLDLSAFGFDVPITSGATGAFTTIVQSNSTVAVGTDTATITLNLKTEGLGDAAVQLTIETGCGNVIVIGIEFKVV